MTWTVFIADDEPKIRRRLKRLIESSGEEFQICGEAGDGIEALELVSEELPDILLVDICMPRLDGLDFIQRIGNEAGDCIIIVVTGHDEFEYAKRAVQLPVFEYLLKPVDTETFSEVLKRAVAELKKRRERNELLVWARQEIQGNRSELIRELFDDWLNGFASPAEIEERKKALSLDFLSKPRLLVLQMNARYFGATAMAEGEHRVYRLAVSHIVEDALGDRNAWTGFEDRHGRLLYLLSRDFSETEREALGAEIRRKVNLPVRLVMSECGMDYEAFILSYERLCAALVDGVQCDAFIGKISSFMDEHYRNKELTLETAAKTLSMSPGYVSRLLKRHTGYSFSEFVNRYRVFKAIRLINQGNRLVYEIADEVGYSSQHYFSRIFKRITGAAPAEFRKTEE